MENEIYEAPCVVYEGELEVQAGTVLGDVAFDWLEDGL